MRSTSARFAASAPGDEPLAGSAGRDSNLYLRRQGEELTLTVEHRAAPSVPAVALELAQRGDALALEVVECAFPAERAPTSVDERITRALSEAGSPVPLAELRAACRVRTTPVHTVMRSGDDVVPLRSPRSGSPGTLELHTHIR